MPRSRRSSLGKIALLALSLGAATPASGSPLEFLPVNDPLEAELRVLDALGPWADGPSFQAALPTTRPVQRFTLDSLARGSAPSGPYRISWERLRRSLLREAPEEFPGSVPGRVPRLFQRRFDDGTRFELSAGAEGAATLIDDRAHWVPNSGFHGRVAVESERWLLFTHVVAGHQDTARAFADPIFPKSNIILYSEDSYLACTGAGGRWNVRLGRTRWHWGPGEEGSLLLSRSAVAMTGLSFRVRIEPIRAEAIALSATLRSAAGEQLAAHRLEWQPTDRLRLGVSEAARYRSEAWQPAYAVGVLPYILVQRFHVQDEPDSANAVRNNIMVGGDIAWRIAPGTRVYAELLADDLHVSGSQNPSKYAWQVGWDGVGRWGDTRLVWGGEYTRASRFVYTSFFGRDHVAQGRPIGFPFAPDAERLRVRAAWDLSADWQLSTVASRTRKGENSLEEPFFPGSPRVSASTFEGVIEEVRDWEVRARWWPASGVDLSIAAGHRWIDDRGHVTGSNEREPYGAFAVSLVR